MRRGATWAIRAAATTLSLGCDSGGGTANTAAGAEAGLAGRKATVEYRPVSTGGAGAMQKQRAGTLIKVSAEWVAVNDEAEKIEVWVPRDMVLEIRLSK